VGVLGYTPEGRDHHPVPNLSGRSAFERIEDRL
jgi:hypothetical protein